MIGKKASGKNLLLGFLFLVAFLFIFSKGFVKLARNSFKLYSVKKQKSELINENKNLLRDMELIKKNEYLEHFARINYGLKKDAEIEYRFTPPGKSE